MIYLETCLEHSTEIISCIQMDNETENLIKPFHLNVGIPGLPYVPIYIVVDVINALVLG